MPSLMSVFAFLVACQCTLSSKTFLSFYCFSFHFAQLVNKLAWLHDLQVEWVCQGHGQGQGHWVTVKVTKAKKRVCVCCLRGWSAIDWKAHCYCYGHY